MPYERRWADLAGLDFKATDNMRCADSTPEIFERKNVVALNDL